MSVELGLGTTIVLSLPWVAECRWAPDRHEAWLAQVALQLDFGETPASNGGNCGGKRRLVPLQGTDADRPSGLEAP